MGSTFKQLFIYKLTTILLNELHSTYQFAVVLTF